MLRCPRTVMDRDGNDASISSSKLAGRRGYVDGVFFILTEGMESLYVSFLKRRAYRRKLLVCRSRSGVAPEQKMY